MRSQTAIFLEDLIALSGKTQRQVGEEVGLKSNALSMMKRGHCRVPIERIPAIARACGMDPAAFLHTALAEYHPETFKVVQGAYRGPIDDDEVRWLMILRGARQIGTLDLTHEIWMEIYTYLVRRFVGNGQAQ